MFQSFTILVKIVQVSDPCLLGPIRLCHVVKSCRFVKEVTKYRFRLIGKQTHRKSWCRSRKCWLNKFRQMSSIGTFLFFFPRALNRAFCDLLFQCALWMGKDHEYR